MKKYRIGYTTDVYDMFHIGHLNIIVFVVLMVVAETWTIME